MLQALRRIEGRRQHDEHRGQDPSNRGQDSEARGQAIEEGALLVRPRRRRPSEPEATDHSWLAASAAPIAGSEEAAPLDMYLTRPASFSTIDPATPATDSQPGLGQAPVTSSASAWEGNAFSAPEPAGTSTCSEPAPQPESPPRPAANEEALKAPSFGPCIRRLDAQFHDLAAQVLARAPAGQPAVIGLCPLEADSLSAVAPLAVAMVRQVPGEVVLLETELFPASLAERLGTYAGQYDRIPLEVLRTGKGWASLARPTGVSRLSLLPGIRKLPVGMAPEGRSLWETAVEELRQHHQLVLVVAGPPYDAAGQVALKCCDAVFVLATLRRTGTRRARRFLQWIRSAGAILRGVILIDPA